MLSLEVLTYYKRRWLSVMLDDEHVAVFGCSPFSTAAPDGDAVNAVDEAPLCIAVVKADVGVGLQFGVRKSFAFENISQVWFATILGILAVEWPCCLIVHRFPLV